MRQIRLSNSNLKALVDDEDYDRVAKYVWYLHRDGWAGAWIKELKRSVPLHRFILGAKPGDIIDHINHDKLDNRKSELRFSSKIENARNMRKSSKKTSSQFKGVYWQKNAKKWRAYIHLGRDTLRKHLGFFESEIDAAKAYDQSARKHFGEFACTNF